MRPHDCEGQKYPKANRVNKTYNKTLWQTPDHTEFLLKILVFTIQYK